jgi:hypothetical protein
MLVTCGRFSRLFHMSSLSSKKKKTGGTSRDKSFVGIRVQTSNSREKVFLYWFSIFSTKSGTAGGAQPSGSVQKLVSRNISIMSRYPNTFVFTCVRSTCRITTKWNRAFSRTLRSSANVCNVKNQPKKYRYCNSIHLTCACLMRTTNCTVCSSDADKSH